MKCKKVLSLILSLAILSYVFCFPVFAEEHSAVMYFNSSQDTADISFDFDFDMLINGDNKKYSKDLAVISSLFATTAYTASDPSTAALGGANIVLDGGKNSRSPLSFGASLGFEDNYFYDLFSNQTVAEPGVTVEVPSYDTDVNDTTAYYFAHKKVNDTEVIILSIRGTNGSFKEWSSNFEVGCDSKEYYDKTGEHPDWLRKENHKGFDVAATRVLKAFESYVKNNVDPKAKKCVLVTGHSRGAAVANIVGKELEDNKDYKSFTYTFAAPNSTTSPSAKNYKTIFNIVNSDDLVAFLPTEGQGFTKYGIIKEVSVEDLVVSDGRSLEDVIEDIAGWFDYNANFFVKSVISSFNNMCSSRSDLYKIKGYPADRIVFDLDDYGSVEQFDEELKSYNLDKYCSYTVEGSDILVDPSPAYAAQVIANLAVRGASYLFDDFSELEGRYVPIKYAFIAAYIDGITDPHLTITYYGIVKECDIF